MEVRNQQSSGKKSKAKQISFSFHSFPRWRTSDYTAGRAGNQWSGLAGSGPIVTSDSASGHGSRVCVKTEPLLRNELPVLRYRPMNLQYSVPTKSVVPASPRLARTLQRRVCVPQACEVEGGGSQSQFDRNLCQTPTPELSHSTLFFQDSDHRFHDCFAPLINGSPCWGPQFLPHPPMLGMPLPAR